MATAPRGRKKFHQQSNLNLGDPEVGTSEWLTEYDIEFASKQGLAHPKPSTRPNTATKNTPRSLKKGFVHSTDYEALNGKFSSAVSSYKDLQLQLASVEQRLATLSDKEDEFLEAVHHEHQAVQDVKDNLSNLTESLGTLLTSVERNRSLMALLSSYRDTPPAIAPSQRALQVQDTAQLAGKLAGLDNKISDLAHAVTLLAMEQRKAAQAPAQEAAKRVPTKREEIEYMPQSTLGQANTFWKP